MLDSLMLRPPTLSRLTGQMDRLLSGLYGGDWRLDSESPAARGAFPSMNIQEAEGALVAEVELPGLPLEDIDVMLVGTELTVSGEYKESCGKDCVFHRRERLMGKFRRTLQLPVDIDATRVDATLRDGVLRIRLPKAAAVKPRKIEIQVAR